MKVYVKTYHRPIYVSYGTHSFYDLMYTIEMVFKGEWRRLNPLTIRYLILPGEVYLTSTLACYDVFFKPVT